MKKIKLFSSLLLFLSIANHGFSQNTQNATTSIIDSITSITIKNFKTINPTESCDLLLLTKYYNVGEHAIKSYPEGTGKIKFYFKAVVTKDIDSKGKIGFLTIAPYRRYFGLSSETGKINFQYNEIDKCIYVFTYIKENIMRLTTPLKCEYLSCLGTYISISNTWDKKWELNFDNNISVEVKIEDIDKLIEIFTYAKNVLENNMK